jgi:hypothetical protein
MEKKYEIERFEKTIQKHYKDVQKYDVARFEYGDYDNWVTAIIIEVKHEPMDFGGGKHPVGIITFQTVWGEQITCYDNSREEHFYLDIVGKAVELKKENKDELSK